MERQFILPLSATPSQRFKVQLAQQRCEIRVYQRDALVYLDLWKDNVPVRQGVLCRNLLPILDVPEEVFFGELFFVDTKGSNHPDYQEFSTRYRLYYAYEDDV